jgi:hypothetical protein
MSVFKSKAIARIGIGTAVIDWTRRLAKDGKLKPKTVDEQVDTNQALFQEIVEFNKEMQNVLSSTEAATKDARIEDLEIVQFRPNDNDAFIRNARLNARSFAAFQEGWRGTLFDDQDRSIGLFPQEPTQATITIQAYVRNLVQNHEPLVTTNEFLLTSVSEASQEKYQIFQTFDDDLIYFFDRNPHIYTYGGVLVNAGDTGPEANPEAVFQWKSRFQALYEKILRGSKCVENDARAILTYENVVREGFLLNFSMTEDARNPLHVPFQFTFFVTKESNNHRALRADGGGQQLPADFVGTDFIDRS